MVQPLWKTAWQLLTKLNILSPYSPPIALLGIYPEELKTYPHENLHMDINSSRQFYSQLPKLGRNQDILQ